MTREQDESIAPPVSAETAVPTGVWSEGRFACATQARTNVYLRRRTEDNNVDEWDEDEVWRELENRTVAGTARGKRQEGF